MRSLGKLKPCHSEQMTGVEWFLTQCNQVDYVVVVVVVVVVGVLVEEIAVVEGQPLDNFLIV